MFAIEIKTWLMNHDWWHPPILLTHTHTASPHHFHENLHRQHDHQPARQTLNNTKDYS